MTETAPVALQTPMAFTIAGALLSSDPADVVVYRNGSRLSEGSVFPSATRVDLGVNALQDGRNDFELEALDTNGLLVYDARTVWAGTRTVLVTVYDPWGYGIQGATVAASLDADGDVQVTGTTNQSGQVSLAHLPVNEAVTLSASAPYYRPWSFSLAAGATSAWFSLDLDNNDFSQGLDGWETSSPRAGVEPHSEASQPLVPCADCVIRGGVEAVFVSGPSAEQQLTAAERPAAGQTMMLLSGGDWDLVVDTKNLFSPQTVTRLFYAAGGATSASVRYRFQTDEIWSAYPQTGQYQNDWFTVTLRNERTNQASTTTQSVSNLLAQFDANAATPWFTLALPIAAAGDPIAVTLTVANAVDNAYLSILYADVVQEARYEISNVQLRDLIHCSQATATAACPYDAYASSRDYKPLTMLSVSPMTGNLVSYDGYVRIHGTITVTGPPTDSLQALFVDVLEGGVVKATGTLARDSVSPTPSVRSILLNHAFGPNGVSVTQAAGGITPVLFEIPSAQLAAINQLDEDTQLHLQLRAQFASGATPQPTRVELDLIKLILYTRTNRFGVNRDLGDCTGLSATAARERNRPPFPCGGDSWARPKAVKWASAVTTFDWNGQSWAVNWNDFSNMHGGRFPIHGQHLLGTEVDGLFDGYMNLDADSARKMLAFLTTYYRGIDLVRVGYSTRSVSGKPCAATVPVSPTNPYWNVILAAAPLPDGRLPRNLIRNTAGHCDHFHVELNLGGIQ